MSGNRKCLSEEIESCMKRDPIAKIRNDHFIRNGHSQGEDELIRAVYEIAFNEGYQRGVADAGRVQDTD